MSQVRGVAVQTQILQRVTLPYRAYQGSVSNLATLKTDFSMFLRV